MVAGVIVAVALAARGARRPETEGSTVAYGALGAAALAVWLLLAALTVDDPLAPITEAWGAGAGELGVGAALDRTLELVVATAPVALAAIPALLWVHVARRDAIALGLATLLTVAILVALAHALAADRDGPLVLRAGLPLALAGLVGAAWCWRGAGAQRPVVYAVTLALLAVGDVATWRAMTHYPVQDGERAWIQAVRTGHEQGP
jgi:hypothetical protein